MRLPEMTTRRWMVAAATVAVLLGASGILRRAKRYQQVAELHAAEERWYRGLPDRPEALAERLDATYSTIRLELSELQVSGTWDCAIPLIRKMTIYHAQLKKKYERAASHPWASVDPDPPPPF
jgi:hypothetical protein